MGIATVHTAVATVAFLLLQGVLIPFVAHWSDRIGRKPIYVMATVGKLVLLLPAFALIHMGQLCASASATPVPAGSQGTADLAKE